LNAIQERGVYDANDMQSYGVYAHGMKSALLNIGASELSSLAKELEQAAQENDIAKIQSGTPNFLERLQGFIARLTKQR